MQADRDSVEKEALLLREKRAIERAQGGDLSALDPIFAQHAEALFMCLLGWVGDPGQAEALLKDTFVTAFERILGFTWQERTIYYFLRKIALDKALAHHRKVGRRKRLCQALRKEIASTDESRATVALSADEERRLAEQRIEATLAGLSPHYVKILRLRLCQEKPRAECAAALGMSVESLDVLLFRAVRAFRKAYGDSDV